MARVEPGAIGLLAKTGRAIAATLAGPASSPRILARHDVPLWHPSLGPEGPYHPFLDVSWPEALEGAAPVIAAVEEIASREMRRLVDELASAGNAVRAIGIVGSIGRDPALNGNPHVRAHAAEGQLFRHVLELAAERCDLPFVSFAPKDLAKSAAKVLGKTAAGAESAVAALGKGVVKPWRAEERAAALAAWAALTGR